VQCITGLRARQSRRGCLSVLHLHSAGRRCSRPFCGAQQNRRLRAQRKQTPPETPCPGGYPAETGDCQAARGCEWKQRRGLRPPPAMTPGSADPPPPRPRTTLRSESRVESYFVCIQIVMFFLMRKSAHFVEEKFPNNLDGS
jgi:hypothetical protein